MENQTGAAITVHTIADGKAEAMEFRVNEKAIHCNEPLKALRIQQERTDCLHYTWQVRLRFQMVIPAFTPGDSVVVVTSSDRVLYQLDDIFE